ncbi:MAG: hypothetical protein AAF570_15420 [Bacteroidota bacterium]
MKRYWIIFALCFMGLGFSSQLSAKSATEFSAFETAQQCEEVTWDEAQIVLLFASELWGIPYDELVKLYIDGFVQITPKGAGLYHVVLDMDGGDLLEALIDAGL